MIPANYEDMPVADCSDDLNRKCENLSGCAGDTSILLSQIADDGIVFNDPVRLLPRYQDDSRTWRVETALSGQYNVYDTSGKRVLMGDFGDEYGAPDILMTSYPAGTYIVVFLSNDGETHSQKILLQD